MYTLDNQYELSKTTFNHAVKRDMYVDYFKYDSKKDNEEYGHTLLIAPESYSDSDGGIYFKIKEFKNGDFVAKLNAHYLESVHEEHVKSYFENNPEMKTIIGEKQLRKFLNEIYKVFQSEE